MIVSAEIKIDAVLLEERTPIGDQVLGIAVVPIAVEWVMAERDQPGRISRFDEFGLEPFHLLRPLLGRERDDGVLVVAVEHDAIDERILRRPTEPIPLRWHRPAGAGACLLIGQLGLQLGHRLIVVIMIPEHRPARAGKDVRRIHVLEIRLPARAIQPSRKVAVKIVAEEKQTLGLEIHRAHVGFHPFGHGMLRLFVGRPAPVADHQEMTIAGGNFLGASQSRPRSQGEGGAEEQGLLERVTAGNGAGGGGGVHGGARMAKFGGLQNEILSRSNFAHLSDGSTREIVHDVTAHRIPTLSPSIP